VEHAVEGESDGGGHPDGQRLDQQAPVGDGLALVQGQ
jgi:hypothetical protein